MNKYVHKERKICFVLFFSLNENAKSNLHFSYILMKMQWLGWPLWAFPGRPIHKSAYRGHIKFC